MLREDQPPLELLHKDHFEHLTYTLLDAIMENKLTEAQSIRLGYMVYLARVFIKRYGGRLMQLKAYHATTDFYKISVNGSVVVLINPDTLCAVLRAGANAVKRINGLMFTQLCNQAFLDLRRDVEMVNTLRRLKGLPQWSPPQYPPIK